MADTPSQLVKTVWTDRRVRAVARLRMAQLAARAYLFEKGQVPTELANLVPEYLDAVPDDPFGGGPLLARAAEGGMLIYSVGPDGVDDDGTAVEGVVKEERKGDMVVEVAAE
jgi:hypothetical protein